jgi:hypothetical protein
LRSPLSQGATLGTDLLDLGEELPVLGEIRITSMLLTKPSAGYFQAIPTYFQQAHIVVENPLPRLTILRFVYNAHSALIVFKCFQDSMVRTYRQPRYKFLENPGSEYHPARGGKQDFPEIGVSIVGEDAVVTEDVDLFLCAQRPNKVRS